MNKKLSIGLLFFSIMLITGCTVSQRMSEGTTDVVEELTDKTIQEIYIIDLIEKVSKTTYAEEQAVKMTEFINIDNPNSYLYQLGTSDEVLLKTYSYQELQKAYWLLEKKDTVFQEKTYEKNNTKNIERILIIQAK